MRVVNWRKIKTFLEWARLTKFVFDLLASAVSLKIVQKLLSYIPQISHDWATIIAWASAALVLLVLLMWQSRHKAEVQGPAEQNTANALLNSSPLNATVHFANAYVSTMYQEIETNTRAAAHLNSPNDHEAFYLKLIALGLPALMYDVVWAYIFKSQVSALMEINRQNTPVAQVKQFYDKAALEFPDRYANYSFDQWMDFIKGYQLVIHHPSGMVEITVRGKDFLKYLTHWGRYTDQRSF
jgi:hypothetical protein